MMEGKRTPTDEELCVILAGLGLPGLDEAALEQFRDAEDGNPYEVWLVRSDRGNFVLKRAKALEAEVYRCFFSGKKSYAPALLASVRQEDGDYLLLEYCPGEDLRHADRPRLIKALEALALMQNEFWQREELYDAGCTMERALEGIERRRQYLGSAKLESVCSAFVELYRQTPRTLCHDDLLPLNVLVGERAVLIDWEYGGVLPYLSSFARLIAHGRKEEGAFFFLSRADRDFAIEYYFSLVPEKHGIAYADYRRALDYFLFYEYCEWIMLGNRFDSRDDERYISSLKLAEETAERLQC